MTTPPSVALPTDAGRWRIVHGEALETLRALPDNSVQLILTDPPYFGVVDEEWDNAWATADDFQTFIHDLAVEWLRVLAPNGSLYCFAFPAMEHRVRTAIEQAGHNLLTPLVWVKPSGRHLFTSRAAQRAFFPQSERIVFAEPVKPDADAKNSERAIANAHHRLAARLYAPIREYLDGAREAAGFTCREVDQALGTNGMAGHWFRDNQWTMPNRRRYEQLQALFGPGALRRDYEALRRDYEALRRDYEALRRDYEALRRPFDVADGPNTDILTFAAPHGGKKDRHVCEKPVDLLTHLVRASSRPGDLVLDCFTGSGSTGEAALLLGRRFLGVELDPAWVDRAGSRLAAITPSATPPAPLAAPATPAIPTPASAPEPEGLFSLADLGAA